MSREHDVQERMRLLLSRLIEQTASGKIRWSQTDREQHFLYSGSKSSVTISLEEDKFNQRYTMALLNNNGVVVEALEDDWEADGGDRRAAPWNDDLERLFDLARREAMGIDKLLDAALSDIEKGYNAPPTQSKRTTQAVVDPWASQPQAFSEEPPF
ncbi:MAG: hypothetical protein JXA57_11385 [Armatimonadetes bacterium]|nr:hypothetical protein [Armatimonadota bacterium]